MKAILCRMLNEAKMKASNDGVTLCGTLPVGCHIYSLSELVMVAAARILGVGREAVQKTNGLFRLIFAGQVDGVAHVLRQHNLPCP